MTLPKGKLTPTHWTEIWAEFNTWTTSTRLLPEWEGKRGQKAKIQQLVNAALKGQQ